MLKGIVARDDKFWQGHPDVAYFKNKFYVVFRESKEHRSFIRTKIKITCSVDGAEYDSPTTILYGKTERWNCPRLSVIGNRMWLICDCIMPLEESFIRSENNQKALSIWIMSTKDGVTWNKPVKTNIKGIVPDRIRLLKSGELIVASHRYKTVGDSGRLIQNIWTTKNPNTRWKMSTVADVEGMNFCEGCICEKKEDDVLMCMMRENSGNGLPAYVSFSGNNGTNWSYPKPTRLFGCHRPVIGQLSSSKYLVTYREQSFSFNFPHWAKNTFACLINKKSFMSEPYCYSGTILPLDHDSNAKSDSGYTGWVQLKTDAVYIVNYIRNEAAKPYIVWYMISEGEF